MLEHTLALLEFNQIRLAVAEFAFNDYTKNKLMEVPLYFDAQALVQELDRVCSLHSLLEQGINLPHLPASDLTAILRLLAKEGTVLEAVQLAQLAQHLRATRDLLGFLSRPEVPPVLKELAAGVVVPQGLAQKIGHVLEDDGSLKVAAVPVLKNLSEAKSRLKGEIEQLAFRLLNDPAYAGLFQTNTPTIKDGRLVLPLKASYKGRLKGIVHEVSASRATLFIEPEAIVEKNNEYLLLESRFQAEVHRLLAELTAEAHLHYPALMQVFTCEYQFDLLQAKARYGKSICGVRALLTEGELVLNEARHPLLGATAVPISLALADHEHILLLTGPNTGGKTVTLKTVGLLACMNQFGLMIPAKEGSSLPLFDCIFADIGDEQSLSQSLSTFQAHIKNIAQILEQATSSSLVLLDELGAGTDPQEGTALAMALLDYFREKQIKTLVTTHHGVLKNYAFSHQGVVNASVEFDPKRLVPTYRIILGLPGESHALTIAERNGLPQSLVTQARKYLSENRTELSKIVAELVEEKVKLKKLIDEALHRDAELKEALRQAQLKELFLRQQERQLRSEGLKELTLFLTQARRDLERIIKEIREGEAERAIQEGRNLISRLEERTNFEEQRLNTSSESPPEEEVAELKEGMEVYLKQSGQEGRVLRKLKDGRVIVETGSVKVTLRPEELTVLKKGTRLQALERPSRVLVEPITLKPDLELNVRGLRLAEAMRRLEKHLDAVLVAGLREFTILHGKGTGTLQQAIHEYLASCPYVASFHFALPEHGGTGKTVVKMKTG